MIYRFSLALILIGTISLIVFALTASVQQGEPSVLFIGASLCILGLLILRRIRRQRRSRADRFRILQRLSGKKRERDPSTLMDEYD
jgi:hypothetical protein